MNSRERVLAKLAGRPVDRLPVMAITMMLASDMVGRPCRDYVTDHSVLVDGQLATAERYGLDYVSVISDPTREACDLGAPITFFDDLPPAVQEDNTLLKDKATLATLTQPDPHAAGSRMLDRIQGAAMLRERVARRSARGSPAGSWVRRRGISRFRRRVFRPAGPFRRRFSPEAV